MNSRDGDTQTGHEPEQAAEVPLSPGLYLVATPIGNLGDLSPRAKDVLSRADRVLCEDTRVTGRLLHLLDLTRPLATYHEHNAERVRPQVLNALAEGEVVALVSDAGTPLVSDPGYKLVRAAREAGHAIVPVPGPSATLAALTASGLPTDRFFFQGFLPAKGAARDRAIEALRSLPATLVLFESAPRTAATLKALATGLGAREAVVARELTKRHEPFAHGTLEALAERFAVAAPKGEVVLVVAGADAHAEHTDEAAIDQALKEALADGSPSDAARRVAQLTGRPRRALYARALELQAR